MKIDRLVIATIGLVFWHSVCAEKILTAEADSRVDGGSPEGNYGEALELFVRDGSGVSGNNEKTYLRFNLGGQLWEGERFSRAILSLTTVRAGSPGVAGVFTIHGIVDNNDNWKEGEITWKNAPGNAIGSGSDLLENTVVLGTGILPAGAARDTQVSFSSEKLVDYLNWVAGVIDDPYGRGASRSARATIILTSTGENAVLGAFYSKEATGIEEREPHLKLSVGSE